MLSQIPLFKSAIIKIPNRDLRCWGGTTQVGSPKEPDPEHRTRARGGGMWNPAGGPFGAGPPPRRRIEGKKRRFIPRAGSCFPQGAPAPGDSSKKKGLVLPKERPAVVSPTNTPHDSDCRKKFGRLTKNGRKGRRRKFPVLPQRRRGREGPRNREVMMTQVSQNWGHHCHRRERSHFRRVQGKRELQWPHHEGRWLGGRLHFHDHHPPDCPEWMVVSQSQRKLGRGLMMEDPHSFPAF